MQLEDLADLPNEGLERRLRRLSDGELNGLWTVLLDERDHERFSRLGHAVTTEWFRRLAR